MKCHAHASPLDLRGAVADLVQRLFLLRACATSSKTAVTKSVERRLRHVERPTSTASASAASSESDFLDEGRRATCPIARILRPGLVHGFVERTDGHLAGSIGQDANWAARRCKWPISRPSWPTGATTTSRTSSSASKGSDSIDRRFYEKPVYDDRPQALRTDRRGNVARRERRRHLDRGAARRTGTSAARRARPRIPQRTRPFDLPVVRTQGQSAASRSRSTSKTADSAPRSALPIASLLVEEYYLTDTITPPVARR